MKDAEILSPNKRYQASIYLAGYAVEIALKYKICKTLQFNNGFPENRAELTAYLNQINQNNPNPLTLNISEIKHHKLPKLLFYSGAEFRIKNNFQTEWAIINGWDPEHRYRKREH